MDKFIAALTSILVMLFLTACANDVANVENLATGQELQVRHVTAGAFEDVLNARYWEETGAHWHLFNGVLYVQLYGSSTCPPIIENAFLDDDVVNVRINDSLGDGPCTRDLAPTLYMISYVEHLGIDDLILQRY